MASKLQLEEKDILGEIEPDSKIKNIYTGICRPYVSEDPMERQLDIIAEDHRKYSC